MLLKMIAGAQLLPLFIFPFFASWSMCSKSSSPNPNAPYASAVLYYPPTDLKAKWPWAESMSQNNYFLLLSLFPEVFYQNIIKDADAKWILEQNFAYFQFISNNIPGVLFVYS